MSKRNEVTVWAYNQGYYVDDEGNLRNSKGWVLSPGYEQSKKTGRRYLKYTLRGRGSFMVHRLCAYQKFGDAMFAPGILVRHLDDDPMNNRPDNIEIGNARDNMMDVPKEKRGRPYKSVIKRHKQEIIDALCAGKTCEELGIQYGIHPGSIRVLQRKHKLG